MTTCKAYLALLGEGVPVVAAGPHRDSCASCADYLRSIEETARLAREACGAGKPDVVGPTEALVRHILAAGRRAVAN